MKYSFILLSGETEGFLERLQELGVVDVTRSARPIDEQSAKMLDDAAATRRMILRLEGIDYKKDADKEAVMKAAAQAVVGDNLAEGVQKSFVELMELEAAKTAAEKEVRSRLPWGEFDKARLDQLETLGYTVRYYTVPAKKFSAQWAELYPLEVISQDKANVWFVTICPEDEEYAFPVDPVTAPAGSWKQAQEEVDRICGRLIEVKGMLINIRKCSLTSRPYTEKVLKTLTCILQKVPQNPLRRTC